MSGLSVVSLVLQVTAVVATVAGAKSLACRSHVYGYPKSLWVALTLWFLSACLRTPAAGWMSHLLGRVPIPVWIGLVAMGVSLVMTGLAIRAAGHSPSVSDRNVGRSEPALIHREHGVGTGDSGAALQ